MSKIIASAAIRGGHACVRRAETMLAECLDRYGRDKDIGFPSTAYALPVILALTGKRVERLGDLEEALATARSWLPAEPTEHLWLPYLGGALDAGAASIVALNEMVDRLAEDHANSHRLAKGLIMLKGSGITWTMRRGGRPESNAL